MGFNVVQNRGRSSIKKKQLQDEIWKETQMFDELQSNSHDVHSSNNH